MRALVNGSNGPEIIEATTPKPGANQVLVKVHACSLNRADLLMLKGATHGFQSAQANQPMGMEWAGEVVELGAGVKQWKVGDRVMSAGMGAFAEYTLGFEWVMYPIPEGMTYTEATTLPVAIQTMHDALATNGQLKEGQSVLIQGASTAVGLMGMQVAKQLGAGLVIGTSTNDERCARLTEFGADLALNSRDTGWVQAVLDATDGKGVDLVIDHVAGDVINDTMRATRVAGRIVNIGRLAGESGHFDFDLHNMKRLTYIGASFRTRNPIEIVQVIQAAKASLGKAIASKALQVPVDTAFAFDDFKQALERMDRNQHFGKIVLQLG
ncbi:quinone oxidoreductase [Pseudomonas sp. BN415]|uniref:quinone oxidoreductase family protein n=1 Tax=Pseudomonas sp. BN415 TaxID=2567889 RepID=UPI0024552A58|nr:zinc-binding dehydrogenase [Pseudomonas sp. BN415]MDH4580744.1 quinone oxidoreductase [Pseudomonas sp. BN415]